MATKGRIQTVVAVEHDGLETRVLAIRVRILDDDPDFSVKDAVVAACTEYVRTPEGKEDYVYNNGCFNWADFDSSVPNDICRKHGFEKVDGGLANVQVDWNQHLVNDCNMDDEPDDDET